MLLLGVLDHRGCLTSGSPNISGLAICPKGKTIVNSRERNLYWEDKRDQFLQPCILEAKESSKILWGKGQEVFIIKQSWLNWFY
jgi:hypothetical protein